MRNPEERDLAFQCLDLAIHWQSVEPVQTAAEFYAFVTGEDTDGAKAKLALVREAIG